MRVSFQVEWANQTWFQTEGSNQEVADADVTYISISYVRSDTIRHPDQSMQSLEG